MIQKLCSFDPWPWGITLTLTCPKYAALKKYTCIMNIKSLSLLDPKLWPKLKIWPLTLENDLDLIMLPIKSCSSWDTRVHWTSTVYLYVINSYDPWPLKVTLTLTCHTPKCVALWDIHACQILSLYLFWFKRYGYLTFDLEGWPWPWHVMFKICSFKKYTYIKNIKSLSLLDPKLWHNL